MFKKGIWHKKNLAPQQSETYSKKSPSDHSAEHYVQVWHTFSRDLAVLPAHLAFIRIQLKSSGYQLPIKQPEKLNTQKTNPNYKQTDLQIRDSTCKKTHSQI